MPKPGWSRRRNGVLRDECTTVGGWCPAGVPALTTQPPDFLRVCVVSCMGEVVHLAQVRGRGDRAARGVVRRPRSSTSISPARSATWPPSASSGSSRASYGGPLWATAPPRRPVGGPAARRGGPHGGRAPRRRAARAAGVARGERRDAGRVVAGHAGGVVRGRARPRCRVRACRGRLQWCGGFELDDPEVLAEAAAAAGLGLEDALHAGGDLGRDGAMEAVARRLLAAGADRLPAVVAGRAPVRGRAATGRGGGRRAFTSAQPAGGIPA
jgi:hypothetical protein